MPLTVGTAGHIDHGKTWLVRALTGKDTDRLPEEQERGISIELGYAPLELPGGALSLVDVPGHERFVRTMVAGATGIDFFLLVIDAGEGARPQTHEHLAILRLLGVERGVVAVTKADAVDAETLELAVAEAEGLVPGAEVVPVSAKTGEGLDVLRAALGRSAAGLEHERPGAGTRLYIDRAFTLTGVGTIVTGTLWSGSIGPGDVLEVQPSGLRARARTVHVHDVEVPRAEAGQRVAVNLPGIDRRKLRRGDALVEPGYYPVSWRLDVTLEELEQEVPAAVTVHVGTSDVPARVVRSGRFAQLRLREPVIAARGDRIVLRTDTTVGGGVVLDPAPPRRLEPERLELLERDDPEEIVRALVREPVTGASLQARGLLAPPELARGLAALEQAGDWHFAPEWLEEIRTSVRERLARRAEESPLDPGLPLAELLPAEPWAPSIAQLLHVERRDAKAYLPGTAPQLGEKAAAAAELEARLAEDDAVRLDDRQLAAYLEAEGRLKRVGDGLAVSAELYDRGREALPMLTPITLAGFRDALGISRKTAQLLLERYDADGLTRRVGDERVLRRSAQR
jgi:selenocysteine-specific elongation factor